MNICLEQELEDALTDLLREDYGDEHREYRRSIDGALRQLSLGYMCYR